MAVKVASRGPIQLRHDVSDEEEGVLPSGRDDLDDASDITASKSDATDDSSGQNGAPEDDGTGSEDSDESLEPEEPEALKDITFGTLAEAQERFAPESRKRKLPSKFDDNDPNASKRADTKDAKDSSWTSPVPKPARTSKHAPTIQSSRQQVSRKRSVFSPPPSLKARDPRFDPAIMSSTLNRSSSQHANKNYAFLTTYQASEILDLKAQIKQARNDPDRQDELKRKVMSIEAKIRNAERQQREDKIVKEHNEKEKAAIKEGKKAKPYYLKESDIRKQAEEERRKGMGKRALDKSEKRKKKREKSKDAKAMPRFRRE